MWFLNSQRNILGLILLPGGCWGRTAFVQYVLLSFCFCFKYFSFALVTLTLSEVYGDKILKFIKIYEHLFIYYYLIQTITLVGEVSYSSKRNHALHLNLNFTAWGLIYWEFFPQPKEKKILDGTEINLVTDYGCIWITDTRTKPERINLIKQGICTEIQFSFRYWLHIMSCL